MSTLWYYASSISLVWRVVLERLSWCVTCLNRASFNLLTVARRGSCGPTRTHKEVDWSCSAASHRSCALSRRCGEVSPGTWFQKPGASGTVHWLKLMLVKYIMDTKNSAWIFASPFCLPLPLYRIMISIVVCFIQNNVQYSCVCCIIIKAPWSWFIRSVWLYW